MQCSYGSIWRKWDFHVHTPYSILNNNYGFNPFELAENDLETEFDEYQRGKPASKSSRFVTKAKRLQI